MIKGQLSGASTCKCLNALPHICGNPYRMPRGCFLLIIRTVSWWRIQHLRGDTSGATALGRALVAVAASIPKQRSLVWRTTLFVSQLTPSLLFHLSSLIYLLYSQSISLNVVIPSFVMLRS